MRKSRISAPEIKPRANRTAGLTLIELIVSLGLIGVLGTISMGFLAPFQINRQSSLETQATAYSRSYLELLKGRWLDQANYIDQVLPNTCAATSNVATCDLKLAGDWTVEITPSVKSTWTNTDRVRQVSITAKSGTRSYVFATLITKP
jgi:type II secretory pathway pseudopilin PulG